VDEYEEIFSNIGRILFFFLGIKGLTNSRIVNEGFGNGNRVLWNDRV